RIVAVAQKDVVVSAPQAEQVVAAELQLDPVAACPVFGQDVGTVIALVDVGQVCHKPLDRPQILTVLLGQHRSGDNAHVQIEVCKAHHKGIVGENAHIVQHTAGHIG